jgi:hypothetical protein
VNTSTVNVINDGISSTRDLARYVQWFDDALDSNFCKQMVESFDQLAQFQTRGGRDTGNALQSSAWTELNVSRVADSSFESVFKEQVFRYLELYNKRAPLTLPVPPRNRLENLRIKRYVAEVGDQFQPHFDSLDYTSNRYMVFLWYLNDVVDGGETEFCDLGLRVSARQGRLLMFPPYWMYQHAGLPPRSNDKYIISTYLLF